MLAGRAAGMTSLAKLDYICPSCGEENRYTELDWKNRDPKALSCAHCATIHPLHDAETFWKTGFVGRCLVCDAPDLYVQRDFDRRLGCLVILVAVALSYHTWGLSLVLAVFADYLLYHLLPEITVCYRCHAIYRNVEKNPAHGAFDPAIGEKYEAEAGLYRNPRVPRSLRRPPRSGRETEEE